MTPAWRRCCWSPRSTPTASAAAICERSRGFVYGVGVMGVTGERAALASSAATWPAWCAVCRTARCASASACRTPNRRPRPVRTRMASSSGRRSCAAARRGGTRSCRQVRRILADRHRHVLGVVQRRAVRCPVPQRPRSQDAARAARPRVARATRRLPPSSRSTDMLTAINPAPTIRSSSRPGPGRGGERRSGGRVWHGGGTGSRT